jgi:hypothetical protein
MCNSILYRIFPFSLPLVLYNTASIKQVFLTGHCRTSQAVLKPFSCSSLSFFITCVMNSLRVSWELQTTRSLMVPKPGCREGGHNFKSSVLYHNWSGNTRVASGAIKLKKHQFSTKNAIDSWFQPLLSLHISSAVNFPQYVCRLFACSNRELW